MDFVSPKPPEEIFPLEVWELILDNLTSPFDLLNCNKACKSLAKLLEQKKITFLMPEVFPILYKYLQTVEADEADEEAEEDEYQEEKEAPTTTILKMRLVSQGWKESIDSYHQNHPVLNDIGFIQLTEEDETSDGEDEPFPLLPYHFIGGEWKSIPKLESFLGKGFSTDSNPLITRYVGYSDTVDNERQQSRLKTAFKNFLEAFGSQIWTCELLCNTSQYENTADFYRLVGSYLSLMPNLRSLLIELYNDGESITDSKQEELELLLQSEALPRLQHLTKLAMCNIPYPLSVGLLASNKQLQKLSFQKTDDCDDDLLPDCIVNVELPSLKQLALTCSEMELLQLPKVSWPIKELSLTIRSEEDLLKNIFLTVSATFSNTLEHFIVHHWNGMENNVELKQTRLELPKLKMFKLEIMSFELETIDFLQACTALQEIQLAFTVTHKEIEDNENSSNSSSMDEENNAGSTMDDEDEPDNSVIKFKDCIFSMNQSNIWRILNNLQSMKIKTNGMESNMYYLRNKKPKTFYPYKTFRFTRRQFEKTNAAKEQI